MKQMVGRLVPVVVLLGGLFWLAERFTPTIAPEDVVDLFVDAGIEFTASPTEASLLEQRKIVIGTDINGSMTQRVVRALLLLDSQDSGRPIDLYIRTEGGRIDDAFAIIDVMKGLKSPVNTHAIGGTHSSGAMILAAGTGVRYAYPFSSIMFHLGLVPRARAYMAGTPIPSPRSCSTAAFTTRTATTDRIRPIISDWSLSGSSTPSCRRTGWSARGKRPASWVPTRP